jgi:hypothetical protein
MTPILLLAFANDRIDETRHLPNLANEAKRLRAALDQPGHTLEYQVEVRENIEQGELLTCFQDARWRNRIMLLHFAGHADDAHLLFDTAPGAATPIVAKALAKFLRSHDNLRLLFLNGCSTAAQAQAFLDAGLQAVIATNQAIRDDVALDFAERFYRGLAGGATLQDAFEEAAAAIEMKFDSPTRTLRDDAPAMPAGPAWPWTLHIRPDAEAIRTWRLSDLTRLVQPGDSAYLNMAPQPPDDFVERPEQYHALRDLLLAGGDSPVAITAALRSAGGFGKTTLAQALCHDEQILKHFRDGILWVELKENPGELTGRLLNLVEKLTGRRPGSTTVDAATAELAQALGDKRLLFVIDDAWEGPHLAPFLQGGSRCTRLITTRIDTILPANVRRIPVDAMQSDEAVQLLGAGLPAEQPALAALATRLGEWPLLLRIINAVLRQFVDFGATLADAIADVNTALTDHGLNTFTHPASADQRHATVAATLGVSLRLLNERELEYYYQLAIFPEDADIPLVTVARLWQMPLLQAKLLCARLAGLSLLLRFDLATNTLRLHDVIRTYLCEGQTDLAARHRHFLARYALTRWTDLPPDEPYLWDHLAYHLIEAHQLDQLAALFADDGWLQARVRHDGYTYDGYLADLERAWQQAQATAAQHTDEAAVQTALAALIHYALIRTTINSLSGNYPPALVARAIEIGLWTPERALSIAYKVADKAQRVKMIIPILATTRCTASQSLAAVATALQAALAIRDEESKAQVLAALAPHLDKDDLTTVLQATLAIRDGWSKAQVLAALAPQLDQDDLTTALQATLAIRDERYKAQVLAALAPHLDKDDLTTAVQAALAIGGGRSKAQVLAALAPQLDQEQRQRALTAAFQSTLAIWDERYKAQVLAALAPHLVQDDLTTALRATLAIRDGWSKVQALAALAPHLVQEQRQRALIAAFQAALAIRGERSKVQALAALAPQLDQEQRQRALTAAFQAILAMDDERPKVQALAVLAPHLVQDDLTTAFQSTLAIWDERYKAQVLAALAPHLDQEQRQQALTAAFQATLAIRGERSKVQALAVLAPHLVQDDLTTAFQSALAIRDGWSKVQALAALAPHLDQNQRQRALTTAFQATLAMDDGWPKAQALGTLAPHLDKDDLTTALQAALAIREGWYKAQVLAALAPHLDQEQRQRALTAAFQATLAIRDGWYKAQALTALAPQLEQDDLTTALQEALALDDERYKAQALVALAPHLDQEQRQRALTAALQSTLASDDEWAKAQVLAVLAPQLDKDDLTTALQATLAIRNEWAKAQALSSFLSTRSHGQQINLLDTIHQAITHHLINVQPGLRAQLLSFLASKTLFVPPIFHPATLATITQSIIAICDEWRWL